MRGPRDLELLSVPWRRMQFTTSLEPMCSSCTLKCPTLIVSIAPSHTIEFILCIYSITRSCSKAWFFHSPTLHSGIFRAIQHIGGILCQQAGSIPFCLQSLGPGAALGQSQPFGGNFLKLPSRERSLNARLQRLLRLVGNSFPLKFSYNSAATGLPSLAQPRPSF